jgi:hypothetical protein
MSLLPLCKGRQLMDTQYTRSQSMKVGPANHYIISRVGVTYKTGFGFDNWIYCKLYIHTVRDYR